MVGINLLILVFIGTSMNVSNAGHAGGAIGGVLLTVPLILLDRNAPLPQRLLGVGLLAGDRGRDRGHRRAARDPEHVVKRSGRPHFS